MRFKNIKLLSLTMLVILSSKQISALIPCINDHIAIFKDDKTIYKSVDLCNESGEPEGAFVGDMNLYDMIGNPYKNLFPVKRDSKWGVITKVYREIETYKCIGKCPFASISHRYEILIPFNYDEIGDCWSEFCTAKKERWGLINTKNEVVIDFKYEDLKLGELLLAKSNGKYGFIDLKDNEVIPFKYDQATNFSENLAMVKLTSNCGFIDKSGKIVIPLIYSDCKPFSLGLAAVKKDRLWGYIDNKGKVKIPFIFEEANTFYFSQLTGLSATVKENGKWYMITSTGGKISELNFDYIGDYYNGLAKVKVDGKFGFIEPNGKISIKPEFDDIMDFVIPITYGKINGKNFIVDTFGRKKLTDYERTNDYIFERKFILVEKNGKKGLLSSDYKDVLPIEFDDIIPIKSIESKNVIIKKNGKYGIVSTLDGSYILNPSYEKMELVDSQDYPHVIVVENNGLKGVIDYNGKLLIDVKYPDISILPEGIIIEKNKKKALFDVSGKPIIPIELGYDDITVRKNDLPLIVVKRNSKYGLYDMKSNKEVIPTEYREVFLYGKDINMIELTISDEKRICLNYDYQKVKCYY